jgi:phosphoribosylanthranilate isomerase
MEQQIVTHPSASAPQVKICGLTAADEALACAELGAAAIGLVFYPPSPRFVTDDQAAAVCRALPGSVWSVGVFVDLEAPAILQRVERCGLRAVQLHGRESPKLVKELSAHGVLVIKALFPNGQPSFADADAYACSHAFLTECVGKRLPGGNGRTWDWATAAPLSRSHRVILAGGLTPGNVSDALRAARPAAVDVSSGVEVRPGRKDLNKVAQFLQAVWQHERPADFARVFP